MKTRNASYEDYGFLPGEKKSIKEISKKRDFRIFMAMTIAAHRANSGIAEDLIYSIVKGISYDKLSAVSYIPVIREDFYAYRRKCLFLFKRILTEMKLI